jgi:peptide/nickel transport system permease protein
MSQSEIDARVQALTNINPDTPLYVQYFDYIGSILSGDFGQSIWYDEPVAEILLGALPWTVFLMATSLFVMFTIGILLGAFMAYWEGSSFDLGSTGLSLLFNSTPSYVVALLFITFLGYRLDLFPTGGRYASEIPVGLNPAFVGSVLYHGALPIAALVVTGFGGYALNMRGNSIRILGEEYLRVARLRGLAERRIATRYVARNALLPMYTNLMIAIGFMFNGAVVLEVLFAYPGLGYYVITALGNSDYPLLMGGFLVITVAMVVAIYIADLTYGWIDPRVKGGGGRESY